MRRQNQYLYSILLKQVMLLSEQEETDISFYGKTGMGKAHGVVVDAWFTGFADAADKRIYFCVYFVKAGLLLLVFN